MAVNLKSFPSQNSLTAPSNSAITVGGGVMQIWKIFRAALIIRFRGPLQSKGRFHLYTFFVHVFASALNFISVRRGLGHFSSAK